MMSMHIMDQGSTINYDIEEKQINLGHNLLVTQMIGLNDDLNECEFEGIK